jgi:oxygen-independent coproporphyrinogen-3 oxidase
MPEEDDILALSRIVLDTLQAAGYRRYEVSNYSKPGRESLHNTNYWKRGRYAGMGAAAHSFQGNTRWKNTKDIGEYIRLLSEGKLPVEDGVESLSAADSAREFLFLGLRLTDGVSVSEAASAYGVSLRNEKVLALVREGLFEFTDGFFRATGRGLQVLNSALSELFAALDL